jgi:hypothetical protein
MSVSSLCPLSFEVESRMFIFFIYHGVKLRGAVKIRLSVSLNVSYPDVITQSPSFNLREGVPEIGISYHCTNKVMNRRWKYRESIAKIIFSYRRFYWTCDICEISQLSKALPLNIIMTFLYSFISQRVYRIGFGCFKRLQGNRGKCHTGSHDHRN